jgi:hypothetical protein
MEQRIGNSLNQKAEKMGIKKMKWLLLSLGAVFTAYYLFLIVNALIK